MPSDPPPELLSRMPPQSRGAEDFLVGAVLRDADRAPDILARVPPEDFYFHANRLVADAVAGLLADGAPTDLVAVFDRLKAAGRADDAGGAARLADLFEAAPTAAGWEYHAAVVRERAALRGIIHAATEAARDAYDMALPAADLAGRLGAAVEAAVGERVGAEPVTAEQAVALGLADFERRARAGAARAGTGFAGLDKFVPAFEPGQLVTVGARPSVGKSALGLALALHAARAGRRPVLFASLEMTRVEIGQRFASMLTGVPGHDLRTGRAGPAGLAEAGRARQLVRGVPLFVDDSPRVRVATLGVAARRVARRIGPLGLVVVDYLQLVEPDDRRADRRVQVGAVARGLKLLARELGCPVLAMAQLNRAAEDRADGRPRMSDLREAGEIEQDSDGVMLLYRKPDQPDEADVWDLGLVVDKNRNGPTGEVHLAYRRACMRFESPMPNL